MHKAINNLNTMYANPITVAIGFFMFINRY